MNLLWSYLILARNRIYLKVHTYQYHLFFSKLEPFPFIQSSSIRNNLPFSSYISTIDSRYKKSRQGKQRVSPFNVYIVVNFWCLNCCFLFECLHFGFLLNSQILKTTHVTCRKVVSLNKPIDLICPIKKVTKVWGIKRETVNNFCQG